MITGYLERPYLVDAYLSGYDSGEAFGAQVRLVIDRTATSPTQVAMQVLDRLRNLRAQLNQIIYDDNHTPAQAGLVVNAAPHTGAQAAMQVTDKTSGANVQVKQIVIPNSNVAAQVALGIDATRLSPAQVTMRLVDEYVNLSAQVDMALEDSTKKTRAQVSLVSEALRSMRNQVLEIVYGANSTGAQVHMRSERISPLGMQQKISPLFQHLQPNYLLYPYLTTPYLGEEMHALQGVQVAMNATVDKAQPTQVNQVILKDLIPHVQTNMIVFKEVPLASQVSMRVLDRLDETPVQVNLNLVDRLVKARTQVLMSIVNHEDPTATQVLLVKANDLQAQVTMVIYNTTQLRFMKTFASRGTPALGGQNWTSDPPHALGDFSPNNVNTDVIEEVFRGPDGATALVSLVCDTGLSQGAFVDTVAILGHNLTRSAQVTMQGSTTADFSTVGTSIILTTEELNMFYIAPDLPTRGFRYWRFLIEDPTNQAGRIQIGTILFGAAEIFSALESFTNPIIKGQKHFKDSIETEGFTAVSNDRALRKYLQLNFENLLRNNGNFAKLEEAYNYARTGLKVLYIPTPAYPSRFAIFGKLTQMPEQTHTSNGTNEEYISLKLDIDESL